MSFRRRGRVGGMSSRVAPDHCGARRSGHDRRRGRPLSTKNWIRKKQRDDERSLFSGSQTSPTTCKSHADGVMTDLSKEV